MMEDNSNLSTRLVGSEIHGFRTMAELDVASVMEEAKKRWLRPNEIHAILYNHKYFTVNVKPVNLPKSGRIVLFDRKMLRNFRKDGHNWKKKKDGKTVKEAHEHLKVGNEERIHVYYAHGLDNPTFVRRCYWLLDKSMEHIVLVHYRETQEGSPATPGNSNSSSGLSEPSGSWPLSEESDSAFDRSYYGGNVSILDQRDNVTIKNHEQVLQEINTLDWDELLVPADSQKPIAQQTGNIAGFEQTNQQQMNGYRIYVEGESDKVQTATTVNDIGGQVVGSNTANLPYQAMENERIMNSQAMLNSLRNDERIMNSQAMLNSLGNAAEPLNNMNSDILQAQDSFGRWMSYVTADDTSLETSISNEHHQPSTPPMMDNTRQSLTGQTFNITDVSPAWALSTEETKILVVGYFNEGLLPRAVSKLYLACGDSIIPVESNQVGVFRCVVSPQPPGLVNLYLTFDGQKPISQVLTFEIRSPVVSSENKSNWEEFQLQMRLSHLLFSSKSLSVFHNKFAASALKDAKAFAQKTSHISEGWVHLTKLIGATKLSFPQAKECLFEVILQNRLQEWLLEQVVAGCKKTERDEQGQGVIHLCAILGYTWAVYPYSCSGLSLDYRDKFGWTALHWAAYHGREKMVATLLSAGAKSNLVTDPTSENPGGCHAADLASANGYDGLSAYLAEKALVEQFNDMTLAGNVSGSLQTTTHDQTTLGNFNEDEMYLKDTLAAYRTAADAAARIQTAFREHSLNVQTQVVESSNPEMEARNIVAALKIQHAFRNYDSRKKLAAAARIQYRFRTWKIRKDFLNTRRQAIRIQSIFRGYQVRKQYRKITWSVGVLEKAILRWRLRRKGFRGLQVQPIERVNDPNQESGVEEAFFVASRKQAEERVERSVVRVQAMFRSRRAQEEYRRMKMEHSKAMLEFEELAYPDTNMW